MLFSHKLINHYNPFRRRLKTAVPQFMSNAVTLPWGSGRVLALFLCLIYGGQRSALQTPGDMMMVLMWVLYFPISPLDTGRPQRLLGLAPSVHQFFSGLIVPERRHLLDAFSSDRFVCFMGSVYIICDSLVSVVLNMTDFRPFMK